MKLNRNFVFVNMADSELMKKLDEIYMCNLLKLQKSLKERCDKNNSKGIDQMIGRRYGQFWQSIVKAVFYEKIEFTTEGLDVNVKQMILDVMQKQLSNNITLKNSGLVLSDIKSEVCSIMSDNKVSLCDVAIENNLEKKAIELKWRIRWNDAKTVKEHVLAAARIKKMGYEPIMMIRRKWDENRIENLKRFENSGWTVLAGTHANKFIMDEIGFNLYDWISHKVNFWKHISEQHDCLKKLNVQKDDFIF